MKGNSTGFPYRRISSIQPFISIHSSLPKTSFLSCHTELFLYTIAPTPLVQFLSDNCRDGSWQRNMCGTMKLCEVNFQDGPDNKERFYRHLLTIGCLCASPSVSLGKEKLIFLSDTKFVSIRKLTLPYFWVQFKRPPQVMNHILTFFVKMKLT